MPIDDQVRPLIADVLGLPLEAVPEHAERADIPQWDSLAHLRLVTAIEEEFDIRFTMETIAALDSVRLVTEKVALARA